MDYYNKGKVTEEGMKLAKQFKIRGVPTTILLNKNGDEFARIVGEVDFYDERFLKWLNQFS